MRFGNGCDYQSRAKGIDIVLTSRTESGNTGSVKQKTKSDSRSVFEAKTKQSSEAVVAHYNCELVVHYLNSFTLGE